MSVKRIFQHRRQEAKEGEPLTLNTVEEFAWGIFERGPDMSEEAAALLDDKVDHLALLGLRAKLGVDADDSRGYEELAEEMKRRASVFNQGMRTIEICLLLTSGFAVTVGFFIGGGWFVLFVFALTALSAGIIGAILWAISRWLS